MINVARLSIIFSLTTTTNHFPFPQISEKSSILDGMIIHAINAASIKSATQSLAHMIWETTLLIYLLICVSNQVYYTAYCTPSSACRISQLIYTNRSNLIVVSNRTAQDILSLPSIWYDWSICSVKRYLVAIIILFYRFQYSGRISLRILISMLRFAHVSELRCVRDIVICASIQ